MSYQRFDTLPEGWAYASPDATEHPMKWSGASAPPAIGTAILINMNQLGSGTVEGYFVEHGWLGLLVNLSDPPDWWKQQNKHARGKGRLAHIFGIEFKN